MKDSTSLIINYHLNRIATAM